MELRSHIGGSPHIPRNFIYPRCGLCGNAQTFFFEIFFPEQHFLHGHCLSMFQCTSCSDENFLIPEMINGNLKKAEISSEFLNRYQVTFRVFLFKNEEIFEDNDFIEVVLRKDISFLGPKIENFGIIGDSPNWIMEDESPNTLDGVEGFRFVLQIQEGAVFPISEDACGQVELDLSGRPSVSNDRFYRLFLGNEIYIYVFFQDLSKIYIITQY